MNKEQIIKNIHKILFIFEKEDFYNYYACLTNQIILLSAYDDNDVLTDNVMYLKGLRNLGKEVTHYEVRHAVLHCMNDIDRRM